MEDTQAQYQSGKGKIREFELTPDGYKLVRVCQDRFNPPAGRKDITLSLGRYFPLDQLHSETFIKLNMVGWEMGDIELRSRTVYPSYDGKRLILEVGCTTVLYLQISPANGATHHHFFIQSHKEFLWDVTTRAIAAKVSRAAQPIVTIAKYEMYFLLGMFSTIGITAWLAVTGSDITVTTISLRDKIKAFRELARTLAKESAIIKAFAPTLHNKMMELITVEKQNVKSNTIDNLPSKVITDEKTQAQVAGILYGKQVLSPKSLSAWGALSTVLIQSVIKSFTNMPDAFIQAVEQRYLSLFKSLANTDWNNIQERQRAIIRLTQMLQDTGVNIAPNEMEIIIKEIQHHPNELQNSLVTIFNAFKQFQLSVQ